MVVKPVRLGGAAHLADDGVEGVEGQPLAGAADVGKEAALEGVVLRAVAGIVRHADLDLQLVDQMLEVLLEQMLCRRGAAFHRRPPRPAGPE